MDAKTRSTETVRSEAIAVNENLSIELTVDEILGDLLYPATRIGEVR